MRDYFKAWRIQLGLLKKDPLFNSVEKVMYSSFFENEEKEARIVNKTINISEDDVHKEQKKHIYKEVLYNFDVKEVYLDSSISLIKLSSMIGTNTTYLSNTINMCFECSFRTLVNRYRIDYCRQLLKINDLSVKDAAKKCGFSSSSAFYAAFKRITGVSPEQYRMLLLFSQMDMQRQLSNSDRSITKQTELI